MYINESEMSMDALEMCVDGFEMSMNALEMCVDGLEMCVCFRLGM